jgi:hypothetical protein
LVRALVAAVAAPVQGGFASSSLCSVTDGSEAVLRLGLVLCDAVAVPFRVDKAAPIERVGVASES